MPKQHLAGLSVGKSSSILPKSAASVRIEFQFVRFCRLLRTRRPYFLNALPTNANPAARPTPKHMQSRANPMAVHISCESGLASNLAVSCTTAQGRFLQQGVHLAGFIGHVRLPCCKLRRPRLHDRQKRSWPADRCIASFRLPSRSILFLSSSPINPRGSAPRRGGRQPLVATDAAGPWTAEIASSRTMDNLTVKGCA